MSSFSESSATTHLKEKPIEFVKYLFQLSPSLCGCNSPAVREKIYFESAVVTKQSKLICAIYFLATASDINRYHRLITAINLVSGLSLIILCDCGESNEL